MKVVPPGGLAGFSQMTNASKYMLSAAMGRTSSPTRRKAKRTTKAKRKTSTKRKASSGRKLKFGSPAWRKKYLKK